MQNYYAKRKVLFLLIINYNFLFFYLYLLKHILLLKQNIYFDKGCLPCITTLI